MYLLSRPVWKDVFPVPADSFNYGRNHIRRIGGHIIRNFPTFLIAELIGIENRCATEEREDRRHMNIEFLQVAGQCFAESTQTVLCGAIRAQAF